jgi:hypothetical protein
MEASGEPTTEFSDLVCGNQRPTDLLNPLEANEYKVNFQSLRLQLHVRILVKCRVNLKSLPVKIILAQIFDGRSLGFGSDNLPQDLD